MNTQLPSLLAKLLPTLALPALLLASNTADAASLAISNGLLSVQTLTPVGWDFSFHAQGVVTHNGQTFASSIDLDCSVDEFSEVLDCVGTQQIGPGSADILMVYDSGTAYWSIDVEASTLAKNIHRQWGEEVLPDFMPSETGISSIKWWDGVQWRHWYYPTSWAETYESITGLPYGDIWSQ